MPDHIFTCLVFPHESADGAANMALDEVLLEVVAGGPSGGAALRTYGWTEATLSLGYFQSIVPVEADPRWRDVPIVRRPTGGGAILHHHEVTYALAVARGHPLSRDGKHLYRAVHSWIGDLLRVFGVEAHRRGESRASTEGRPLLCFSDEDAEDVVVGPIKVVGSAQRRRAGAILQHGSILLSRSPLAPELAGLADLGSFPSDAAGLAEIIRRDLPKALGFAPLSLEWPEPTKTGALKIEAEVYRSTAWTRRR